MRALGGAHAPMSSYPPPFYSRQRHSQPKRSVQSLLSQLRYCCSAHFFLLVLLLGGHPGLVRGAAAGSTHALNSGWTPANQRHTHGLRLEHGLGQGQGLRVEQGLKAENGSGAEHGSGQEHGLRTEQGVRAGKGLRAEKGVRVGEGQGAKEGEQAVAVEGDQHRVKAQGQRGGTRARQGIQSGASARQGKRASQGVWALQGIGALQGIRTAGQGTRTGTQSLRERSLKAQSANPCSVLPVYAPSGKVILNNKGKPLVLKDWSSRAETSYFLAGPCLTVSAIHVIQTPAKTVIAIDRSDAGTGYNTPGPKPPKKPYFAVELTLATRVQRGLNIIKDAFCSTGSLMPDGSFISIGGFQLGVAAMRSFRPCTDKSCDFELLGKMKSYRWYPTAQILGDGRVLIVGGQKGSYAINVPQLNSPNVEYWPPGREGLVRLPFLARTLPHNQYPIVHLLPSGLVFIFAGLEYTLFNTVTNQEASRAGGYPALNKRDGKGRPIFRCSPSSAASALLPLSADNGYRAEVIICGGPKGSFRVQGSQILETADDMCWRIFPDVGEAKPTWVGDRMCYDYPGCAAPAPRVMGQAVLLADGSMLLIGGARMGFAGYRSPGPPTLRPLLYFPGSKTWYTKPLATSYVPRLYHSSALLLHDATVLVAGSGPNVVENTSRLYYPTESRTEFFYPPYLQKGSPPSLKSAPPSVPINSLFSICFQSASARTKKSQFQFALSFPGFATHGLRHGMRHIKLEIVTIEAQGGRTFGATLRSPPNLNIAPPTSYWLFVLERGIPNREGTALKITPPAQKDTDKTFPLSRCRKP